MYSKKILQYMYEPKSINIHNDQIVAVIHF